MKKYLFIITALVLASMAFAGVYTIGTGAYGSNYAPFNGSWDYGYNKLIYTKAQINDAGLTTASDITGIAFNVTNTPTNFTMTDQSIYLRNTSTPKYDAAGANDHPDSSDFDLVFHGDLTFNGSGWVLINFSNSFAWDGISNLEFLFEDHSGATGYGYPYFAYTGTYPDYMVVYKGQNNYFPQGLTGSRTYNRPNIQLHTPIVDPPAATSLLHPADGAIFVPESASLAWNSILEADGYKLYFGTTNPPAYLGDLGDETTYTPTLAAATTYYWQVVPYNNFGDATLCPVWSFETSPAGAVMIGDGIATDTYLPINTRYNYSYSQSIYLQEDIDVANKRIEKISYYWNAAAAGTNNDSWTIYMGHIDNASFSSNTGWLPLEQLTEVYSGTVDFPNSEGWMNINLDTPFVYNNSQNLVIAVLEDSPGRTLGGSFLNTVASSRSLRHQHDNTIPDPAVPTAGVRQGHFPNIIMEFGDLPAIPIFNHSPEALDFGTLTQNNPSAWQNVSVSNRGSGILSLSASDISILGADAAMFEFDDVNLPAALESGMNIDIPVRVTVTAQGAISATLRMVYDGTNYDVALTAEGLPVGMVGIGNGNLNEYMPVNPYYHYSYSQSIYRQQDINLANGRIEKISYHWNGAGTAANSNQWDIYMGHTDNDTFSGTSGWIPLDELTPVFSGTVNISATTGWITITLDSPFVYNNSQNLVIAVDENKQGYDGSTQFFFNTSTQDENRSIRHQSDSVNADPASPPSGILMTAFPNILMQFGEVPAAPIFSYEPVTLDFGTLIHNHPSAWQNVIITNSGGGILNLSASDISIIGNDPAMFEYDAINLPAAIMPGASINIPVRATASVEGALSAILRIVYEGVNHDVTLVANGLPQGTYIIGDGDATARYPLGSFFGYERSAALYTATEMGSGNKRINTLGWFASSSHNVAVPTKIYLKSYGGNTVTPDVWANMIAGATPVFDATISGIDADAWHLVTLTNTFDLDSGENLLVLVERNFGAGGAGTGNEHPALRATTLDGMHQVAQADHNPPTTNTLAQTNRPDLMFFATDYDFSMPPATPILTHPADMAVDMPIEGFDLTWQPDLSSGGMPSYYAVFMSLDEDEIYNDFYIEMEGPRFNPITDSLGEIEFGYQERWYWTVVAGNQDGESDPAAIRSFQIEADPTITSFPWSEGFESYADFTLDLEPWSQYDGDGMTTYGIEDTTFPNQYYVGSFIAFNPDSTTPALPNTWAAHGGNKYAVAFDANGAPNDDWLITPPIQSPGALKFGFWARSITAQYGLERFNVLISTTDTNPASFSKISDGIYTEAPTIWTKYEYPLNVPADQIFYLAIQCVSDDAFAFFVDDVELVIPQSIDLAIYGFEGDNLGKVNTPAIYEVTVANAGISDVGSYDIYLKDSDSGANLAILNVNHTLAAGAAQVHEISWTPTHEGVYDIYAEVYTAGDNNSANNSSASITLTVYSEDMQILYVGDPETGYIAKVAPFNYYFEDSVVETIYLASEMQATSGTIEALVYINYFDTAAVDEFQIWMKNTDVNDLMGGWLPWDGYALVYDGPIGGPAGLNLIQIPITPFSYTGGNIAIRSSRTWNGTWADDKSWLVTVDADIYPGRTRIYYDDGAELDHINPPLGEAQNFIPNVIFFMDTQNMIASLEAPSVEINLDGTDIELDWQEDIYAYQFNIYTSDDPYTFGNEPEYVVYGGESFRFGPTDTDKQFYKVTAETYRDLVRSQMMRPGKEALQKGLRAIDIPVHKTIKVQRASK